MGMLVEGVWHDVWYDTTSTKGHFERSAAQFRNFVTADGQPGPTGRGGFPAEAGRYHLYISLACPWAHRTLILRKLKGLEDMIGLSIVHPHMLEKGWVFSSEDGATIDHLFGSDAMWQVYVKADPTYSGRVTVPVLWDKKTQTIVSNESSEIIRMFNSAFNNLTGNLDDYYPQSLRGEIDALNATIYDNVNNGVYKCGFASTQVAYEKAFDALFGELDALEERLSTRRYLMGAIITEADWRLFTTLIRFDAVYVGHFKTNLKRIADYPNLQNYLKDLYQVDGVAETVNMAHIKSHYYFSHRMINPTGIVPKGPELDLTSAHGRQRLG